MKHETRARRGPRRVSDSVFRQVDIQRYASALAPRQDLHLANRFGLPPATAALIAELAFSVPEHWGRA